MYFEFKINFPLSIYYVQKRFALKKIIDKLGTSSNRGPALEGDLRLIWQENILDKDISNKKPTRMNNKEENV